MLNMLFKNITLSGVMFNNVILTFNLVKFAELYFDENFKSVNFFFGKLSNVPLRTNIDNILKK